MRKEAGKAAPFSRWHGPQQPGGEGAGVGTSPEPPQAAAGREVTALGLGPLSAGAARPGAARGNRPPGKWRPLRSARPGPAPAERPGPAGFGDMGAVVPPGVREIGAVTQILTSQQVALGTNVPGWLEKLKKIRKKGLLFILCTPLFIQRVISHLWLHWPLFSKPVQ